MKSSIRRERRSGPSAAHKRKATGRIRHGGGYEDLARQAAASPEPQDGLRDRLVRDPQLDGDRMIAPTLKTQRDRRRSETLVRRHGNGGPKGPAERPGAGARRSSVRKLDQARPRASESKDHDDGRDSSQRDAGKQRRPRGRGPRIRRRSRRPTNDRRGLPQNLWVGAVGMARGWCPSAASSDPGGCACAHRGQGASLRSAPASRGTALTAAPRTRPVGSCPTTPEQRPCGVVDDRRESGRPSIPFPVPIGRIPFRNPRQSALQNIQASRKGTGCNSRLC